MKALKNFGIDKLLENAIKNAINKRDVAIGAAIGFIKGKNNLADEIAPIASKLLRDGSPEGGKLMSIIKKTRKGRL